MRLRGPVAAALLVLAVACLLPRIGLAWAHADGNLVAFQGYGERIADGEVPYRDFAFEYPPGAIPVVALPTALPWSYATSFRVLAALLAAAAIPLVARLLARLGASRREVYAGTAFVPLALLAFGGTALQRYDLLPALLVVAALLLLLAGRPRLAFAAIALGALAKVFPLLLAPIAFVHVWRTHGRREAVVATAVATAIGIAVLAPLTVLAPGGLYNSFAEQANRHLQLESLGASALLAAGSRPPVVPDAGAFTLQGATPDAVARAHGLLQLVALLAVIALYARGRRRLVAGLAAATAVLAILGKTLSPQYLLWLLPLLPAVSWLAAALLLPALVLSQVIYPHLYTALEQLHTTPIWTLAARNALLVIVLAVVLRAGRAPRAAAGSAAAAPTRSR